MSMSLDQYRERIRQTEAEVYEALQRFSRDTGVTVDRVEVWNMCTGRLGDPKPIWVLSGVSLETHPL